MNIKRKTKIILRKVLGKNVREIKKILYKNKFQILSFDIFDTLIIRDTGEPASIFALVDEKVKQMNIGIDNFMQIRVEAEKKIRSINYPYEVTIDDIYDVIRSECNISVETAKYIKELEIHEEFEHCIISDNELLIFYNNIYSCGIKIIFVSDMYLPKEIIKKILNKNGIYNYSCIYLSNQSKYTKKSGLLFRYVLQQEKVEPTKIMHIGDNPLGDYLRAKQYGIKAVLWK